MQRQAAPNMEGVSGELMNETKLGMHMYKYEYPCVMKQNPTLDSSCREDGARSQVHSIAVRKP